MQHVCIRSFIILALCCRCFSAGAQSAGNASAQADPLAMQYFQNQYLANPAMAGIDTGLHIHLAYRKQWEGMPGVPVTKALTADYLVGRRVGAGLQVYNDNAGLLSNTRVAVTYAYHLPLNSAGTHTLHFGLSAAFYNKRLDAKEATGNPNDPSIGEFNRRDNYFEGDFGLAWTFKRFTLQAALPDMVSFAQNKENDQGADRSTFFAAAAYWLPFGENGQINSIEPKICFRGVKGFDNIVDLGANITALNNWVNFFGLYHTTGNFTAGAGVNYKSTASLLVAYTSQTAGLRTYADGTFQVSLRINLLN